MFSLVKKGTAGKPGACGVVLDCSHLDQWARLTVQCFRCREDNPADARFCMTCGTALRTTCRHCGQDVRAEALFCSACGRAVENPSRASHVARAEAHMPRH